MAASCTTTPSAPGRSRRPRSRSPTARCARSHACPTATRTRAPRPEISRPMALARSRAAIQIAPDSPKLAVVMVGLPARGKSYTARRVERYLSWLGYCTRVFNVGEYRRARVGAQLPHSFFDPDNRPGEEARRLVALAALEDMVAWLGDNGQVAIYDATNTTRARRAMVRERCERAGFQVLFIEIRCDDPDVIEAN